MALDLWWEILLVAVASVVGCYCCSLVVWNSVYPDDENPARNDVENPAWEGRDDSDVENQLVEFVPTRQLAAYGFLPLAITSSVKISRMTITQSSSRDPKIESS